MRRGVLLALGFATAALTVLAVTLIGVLDWSGGLGLPQVAMLIAVAVAGAALWIAGGLLNQHFGRLEQLRGAVLLLAEGNVPLPLQLPGAADEIDRLRRAIADLAGRRLAAEEVRDRKLEAVLAAIVDGIVVITGQGQISLVNAAGRNLLGAAGTIGTSIFDVLDRTPLLDAMTQAEAAGRPLDTVLPTVAGEQLPVKLTAFGVHGGAVLALPAASADWQHHLEHDLALHDRPPAALPPTPDTDLRDLPAIVLDTETTGLDPERDRIVAVGALRAHGARLYRALSIDSLVNPGRPIPARATAVHGISDGMVQNAPGFAATYARLRQLAEGCAVIGHNIGFDLTLLRSEVARLGASYDAPPALDTMLLAAALRPDMQDLNLESIAEWLGVPVRGRHTALGDALVTGEIWVRLLPLLRDRGVLTFADAVDFSRRPKRLIERQRAAGW